MSGTVEGAVLGFGAASLSLEGGGLESEGMLPLERRFLGEFVRSLARQIMAGIGIRL